MQRDALVSLADWITLGQQRTKVGLRELICMVAQ